MSGSLGLFGRIPTTICHQGQEYVNTAKYAQKLLVLTSGAVAITANGTANGTLTPQRDQGDQGDAEIYYLMAKATGPFSVKFYSDIIDKYHSNQPVESTLICGNAQFPGRLLETLFVPAGTSVTIEVTDLSGAANSVEIVGIGQQVLNPIANLGVARQDLIAINRKDRRHAYWLTTDAGARNTLAANTTSSYSMTVPNSADFNAFALLARSSAAFNLNLIEGQQRSLISSGAPIAINFLAAQTITSVGMPENIIPACGTPFVFPFTHLFNRGTIITASVQNPNAFAITFSLAMPGQLLYYPPAPSGLTHLNADGRTAPAGVQGAPSIVPGVPMPGAPMLFGLNRWR